MAAFKQATGKHRSLKSDFISASVNTNPVVIRRILGTLRKAGLVISQTGPDGGSRLGRDPDRINLLEIYQAVEDGQLFHLHYRDPNQNCPIGGNIQTVLCGVFSKAENAMRDVLSQTTLAQIAQDIMDQSGISEKLASGFTVEELQRDFVFECGRFIPKTENG
jgi:Rrf2 family protein